MPSPSHDALVARLAEYARKHPRGYRARVAGLALLGYAYLIGIVALLAAAVAGLVWLSLHNFGVYAVFKLGIPIVLLIWFIGKSLWVRFTPPEGIPLAPADAPRLTAEIERVRTAMQAPRVHHVLVTDEFNAGVSQYPRLGIFGGYRVYLVIGLPLLEAMPPEEFRAVLAHEFGHVSRAHGRFGAWIQRVLRTWLRLLHELDDRNHPAQGLFTRFFRWYAPYFEAYTSVLSRAQEFEADEMANGVSPGALGTSLCRMEVASRFIDRAFWPDVYAATRTDAAPPADVHHRMAPALHAAGSHALAADWLAEGMRQPTRTWDSHPATAERLAALGVQPGPPPAFGASAAEALLGPRAKALADDMSRRWAEHVKEYWAEQHARAAEITEKLAALDTRDEPLSDRERGERIWMTAELHGDPVAVPMARAFLDAGGEDASVHFLLGRALAQENDDAALPHLERAMSMDDEYTMAGCGMAAAMLQRLAREEEAAAYHARWEVHARKLDAANEERRLSALRSDDRFIPHGLDAARVAAVREQLRVPGVKRAYLLRKRMEHFPEHPLYIVGVVPTGGLKLSDASQRLANALVERIELSGTFFVIVLDSSNRAFERAFRDVHAAEIFRAPSLLARATGRQTA